MLYYWKHVWKKWGKTVGGGGGGGKEPGECVMCNVRSNLR